MQVVEDRLVPSLRGYDSHTEPVGAMLASEISVPALMYHVFDEYGEKKRSSEVHIIVFFSNL